MLYRHLGFYPDSSVASPSPASPGPTQGSRGPGITPGHLLIGVPLHSCREASLVTQIVKNLPAVQETRVRSLGREDPLEKSMATHSSILAWEILWTEEPGGLQSMGSRRVGHD